LPGPRYSKSPSANNVNGEAGNRNQGEGERDERDDAKRTRKAKRGNETCRETGQRKVNFINFYLKFSVQIFN
jgi:hypothetical protein